MFTPFSGLPIAVRSFLLVIFGVAVLGIGLSLRSHEVHQDPAPATPEPPILPAIG